MALCLMLPPYRRRTSGIYIQLRHTHPEGVLQYSAVKLVMFFHSMDEMLVAAHGVIKAMTLCEESIKLRMSPPSATHVRAYMVVMNGEPSGTQPPTPNREEEPQLSPYPLVTYTQVGDPMSIADKPWGW